MEFQFYFYPERVSMEYSTEESDVAGERYESMGGIDLITKIPGKMDSGNYKP